VQFFCPSGCRWTELHKQSQRQAFHSLVAVKWPPTGADRQQAQSSDLSDFLCMAGHCKAFYFLVQFCSRVSAACTVTTGGVQEMRSCGSPLPGAPGKGKRLRCKL
jgi:hypothetical protein